MGKRNKRDTITPFQPPSDWETERTLEAAEADTGPVTGEGYDDDAPSAGLAPATTACICGHRELLLQAYFAVSDGKLEKEPLEVEGLTCPECEREYEAVIAEDGRIMRGDFVGFADEDEG